MSTMVNAFSGAILKLAKNTIELLRKIENCNINLSAKMDNLSNSFADEGIDIIRKHVNKTKSQITEVEPEFKIFLGKLMEYAKYLEKSQKVIENVITGGSVQQESVLQTKPKSPEWIALHNKSEWAIHPNGSTYGYPQETVEKLMLNCNQNEEAVPSFNFTCALVCGENMLKISGRNDVRIREIILHGLDIHKNTGKELFVIEDKPSGNGGVRHLGDLVEILNHFGLPCELEEQNIENIEGAILDGKILMMAIKPEKLYDDMSDENGHAVIVIGVEWDAECNLTHFYLVDSDNGGLHKIQKEKISNCLFKGKHMVVTKNKVRFFNDEHNI